MTEYAAMKDLPILNLYHSEIEPDIARKIGASRN